MPIAVKASREVALMYVIVAAMCATLFWSINMLDRLEEERQSSLALVQRAKTMEGQLAGTNEPY
ncbi:hypothetical protein VW35_16020 [Devosia soli]|uniref:Uncharacterized protein n=1 Tax=Devosia soli TaxID=361041 RepID=A0A0F5L439_9HYPH|nr:hypothetical protein [Devosia soli]KKB76990.1 hypothetical protein VW35_16020 [Devosia soli]